MFCSMCFIGFKALGYASCFKSDKYCCLFCKHYTICHIQMYGVILFLVVYYFLLGDHCLQQWEWSQCFGANIGLKIYEQWCQNKHQLSDIVQPNFEYVWPISHQDSYCKFFASKTFNVRKEVNPSFYFALAAVLILSHRKTSQGSKLRPIRSPMRLAFSPWQLELLFSCHFGDLCFA